MVSGLMLLAAAGASQLSVETESDMRCLAVIALVAGNSEDKQFHAELTRAAYFFAGKITARDVSLDIGPHIRRILREPEFGVEYRKVKFVECFNETEAARKKMAKVGEALSEGVN